MRNGIRFLLLTFVCALTAAGQTFSSGSTGADGALDLTAGDRTVQLPDSGILNYTTVNIPAGKTLTFQNNLANTPVIMLVQGAVKVSGNIDLSAVNTRDVQNNIGNRTPGPGGFYGGISGQPGFGPGGGAASTQGRWVGPLSLVPNTGGSGAGSWMVSSSFLPGGSGGGAITIASTVSFTLDGSIFSNGGFTPGSYAYWFETGAKGAIRLVSNSINVSGSLTAAVVRLEAPLSALTYTGSGTAPVRSTVNPAIVPINPPALNITSVGGYAVPSYSGSSFSTIDVLLPTQLQDPIPVVVHATNVPVGSSVSIAFSGSSGATSTTANLAGTNASSQATVYVSGVNRSAVTYLFASSTFSASLIAANLNDAIPTGLSKIELAAAPGQKTKYRFLRDDGSEISAGRVPEDIRRLFGL